MILPYTSIKEQSSGVPNRDIWIAKLQEGFKSTTALEQDLLNGISDTIEELQEEAKEKAEEEAKEGLFTDDDAVSLSVSNVDIKSSSDLPKTPSRSTIEVKA